MQKEIKSLYRQLSKTNVFIQIFVGLVVLIVLYYLLNPNRILYNLNAISRVHYSREGLVGQPKTLVYYHMEGCPYCKKFDPNWEKFKS